MLIEPSLGADENPALTKAILLYENGAALAAGGHSQHGSICLATLHSVVFDHEEARSVITEGRPLTTDAFNVLWREMNQKPTRRSIIPGALLFQDDTCLMWWKPSHRAMIYFSTADVAFNKDVHGKEVLHPALVFQATPSGLTVFALPDNERPDASTLVSVAPYCNLYERGDMCRGDVRLPDSLDVSRIAAWERVFFDSRFTHTNLNPKKLTLHPAGHHGLWREMVTTQETIFPAKYLTPTPKSVETLLRGGLK